MKRIGLWVAMGIGLFLTMGLLTVEQGYAEESLCGTGASLCTRGAVVPCADLGATWARGTATCRGDCSGYDVSTCTRAAPLTNRERVRPADGFVAKLHLRRFVLWSLPVTYGA